MVGHLGTNELAASALATMWCNVTGYSVGIGMASALDTLCAQSHTGSSDPHALGKHLQRGIVVVFFLTIPIVTLWFWTGPILLLLGQDPEVAELSARFVVYLMPGLFPYLVNDCIKRFLQGQGIMKASLYVTIVVMPLNILLQWVLVYSSFSIGVMGAPLAVTLIYWIMMFMSIGYASKIEGYEKWNGWDWKEALDWVQIKSILKLGFPGILMLCSEWWAFEVVALAAGILGKDILAAQTVVLNTCSLTYAVPLGLATAASTRIGNLLGGNRPNGAARAAHMAILIAILLASINSLILYLIRPLWGYIWTSDEGVVSIIRDVLPLAALFQLADGMGAIGGGVLRGSGRQKLGAAINLTGYYILGLPAGLVAAFHFNLGLYGLWLGLTVALFIVSIIQVILIYRTDWKLESDRALILINSKRSSVADSVSAVYGSISSDVPQED